MCPLRPAATAELYRTLAQLRREGRAILAVTHDSHDGLADATHVLELGREPFFGTWSDWMARRGSAGKGGAE